VNPHQAPPFQRIWHPRLLEGKSSEAALLSQYNSFEPGAGGFPGFFDRFFLALRDCSIAFYALGTFARDLAKIVQILQARRN
jgi:hypothetical protein